MRDRWPPDVPEELEEVYRSDLMVRRIFDGGGSPCDCVRALVQLKDEYLRRLLSLQQIAPRKHKLPDGRIAIWRCPDDAIPLSTEVESGIQLGTFPSRATVGLKSLAIPCKDEEKNDEDCI